MKRKTFKIGQVTSRILIFIYGAFLVIEDLFIHNIRTLYPFIIFGFKIEHLYIGLVLVFASLTSLYFILNESRLPNPQTNESMYESPK